MKTNRTVEVWEETITIPTYPVGEPEKNPMFFEKRVYQGSSGTVYPYPIIEKIYDEKHEQSYTGLFLENEYLKILVLPELGGRIQTAYDKIEKRHFVYHNQVIKPALVGLLGPWISGGIEFNWPQHHRPSTFQPIDYTLEENEDGSKTIWTNEIEFMNHTKGLAGFRLHPGKAYLEINVQLFNRTALPQTFLWWANPAVSANEHYQSVFPPDVNAVFDHGKRDVTTFPIATGTYYKVDYSPGTDISRFKNIPVPTSYMAIESKYDFIGGYENDSEAGLLHVANHHISPGKKQWTWGNGDFGKAWERNLTDQDGAYVELMTGVYTDNQPDFSWLMPMEEKSFTQYFFPYRKLGIVKNATKDLLLNIDTSSRTGIRLMVYATGKFQNLSVTLLVNENPVFNDSFNISPESEYIKKIELKEEMNDKNYRITIQNQQGDELISYDPTKDSEKDIPEPAKPAKQPEEIESTEQLYLTGLHLEQYRHATYRPEAYYKEALRRDPDDIRNNNALGRWYLRQGRFEESEKYFRRAIDTSTERNPNPYDGEPFYNLGICLKYQGRLDEAYDAFYKSTWNSEWQAPAYFFLAEIDLFKKNYRNALKLIDKSLERNCVNSRALSLKAAILRKMEKYSRSIEAAKAAVKHDKFHLNGWYELYLNFMALKKSSKSDEALETVLKLSRNDHQNIITYGLEYASAGLFNDAISLIKHGLRHAQRQTYPMVLYYIGWLYNQNGDMEEANRWFQKAAGSNSEFCFPNRLEAIPALKTALQLNKEDAKAAYYLGCLYYDKRQHDLAINYWEKSRSLDNTFPTVHRNLGIGYFNKKKKADEALTSFEKAFELAPSDARVFMELDQLYKRTGRVPHQRLDWLENHPELVDFRDDLYLERASLYNFLGRFETAYQLIMARKFHPWEGGEGKVSNQYVYSLIEMAKQHIEVNECEKAIELLQKAQSYPPNLGEGKLYGTRENDIFYWTGTAYEKLGITDKSRFAFAKATEGQFEPEPAIFYNDQSPDMIYYQGLAWIKLNKKKKGHHLFQKLINYGKQHRNDDVRIDYFAVSLPDLLIFDDDLQKRNRIHCNYMEALGYMGMNDFNRADKIFDSILEEEPMHFGTKTHQNMISSSLEILP